MKKSTRFALVAPASRSVLLDFGKNRDLMDNYIADAEKRYGSKPVAQPVKLTTIVIEESANAEDTRTAVGITLLFNTSLVLTTDGNIAVHDRSLDLYTSVGPATLSTLNAIIDAAERLKVHAK